MIITDEKALRVECLDVLPEEIGSLREALEKELNHSAELGNPGLGLAAPQIGIAKNMAIVRHQDFKIDLVNCKIARAFDKTLFKGEGCLSFPGKIVNTYRYQEVHVLENIVKPNAFIVRGVLAVVCQHELNHLESILLTDVAIKNINKKHKLRPNDPCLCGSGKKYKKCCKK